MSTYWINIVYILASAKSKKPAFFQIFSSYFPDSWQQKKCALAHPGVSRGRLRQPTSSRECASLAR